MSAKAHIGAALLLFVLFAAYGLEATTIPSFPGQELEVFKPRSMPLALAVAGLVLCAIRILQLVCTAGAIGGPDIFALNWKPTVALTGTMLGYGFLLQPLGFVAATSLFLAAGFLILGERRLPLLLVLPPSFSLVFFLLMTRLLGLYLAPGNWWGD